jgi:hypothetical protein
MTHTAEHWRLNILAQGDRLIATAMDELHDSNAAHLMVHDVMYAAMSDVLAPVPRRDLDTELGRALQLRPASDAAIIA